MRVFEVDRPGPQDWKRRRLTELGFGIPDWLRLVPVDFEGGASWRERVVAEGFATSQRAVVASTGVSMYLTREANMKTLRDVAGLATGSILAMSFLVPMDRASADVRPGFAQSAKGARAGGTPFISFFEPAEIMTLAREAGFRDVRHVSGADLGERYFAGRTDGLKPPSNGEEFLVATA
jgi:methyltransferase (TIGR00027 family)